MTQAPEMAKHLQLIATRPDASERPVGLLKLMDLLGIAHPATGSWIEKLPFAPEDTTAGTETELQTVVVGPRRAVDLPRSIEDSKFYRNINKRAATGDTPRKIVAALEAYLDSPEQTWENSWVRFPRRVLNAYAGTVFRSDMRADKRMTDSPPRCDADRFACLENGEEMLRIPVSYLLKLALAHIIGQPGVPAIVQSTGEQMMEHFLNDNTSPETHSFHPLGQVDRERVGKAVAVETLLRYLLTQLLVQYANQRFELACSRQKVIVYFGPHPPVRQRMLNDLIPDVFYRELFMSPCLSGWHCGEEKHGYMALCHEVLSRSQLNALGKLKEAGIIANNLVVLPNTSNISLANNGTHLSLSSRVLTGLMADSGARYGDREEKYYGDLVIKICEHFLPLFVGIYSAAPYRFAFRDFHPERLLGFLPHELDYTHLRMIWRRWKRKAANKFFGHAMTPYGPEWLDRAMARLLWLRGDCVSDFRLLDYLVALLSTDESPALDGRLGSDERLRGDLENMGVFNRRMPLYLLCRLRQYRTMGFSGYEARYYSLFENIATDMGSAVDLHQLVTLLAYKYIFLQKISHGMIPDNPTVESERRQFFFGAAIGLPTLYVAAKSANQFMTRIVRMARHTRASRRYSGYIRITLLEYRRALLRLLREDAADLIEMLRLKPVMEDLDRRVNAPDRYAVDRRLTHRILKDRGARDPLKVKADEFNRQAEAHYRQELRQHHIREAFVHFRQAVEKMDCWPAWRSGRYNRELLALLGGDNLEAYLATAERGAVHENLSPRVCEKLIGLLLLVFHQSKSAAAKENR
jgi:hypothetical protein